METIKIGINGFGRIGRMVFRAAQRRTNMEIVAINDLMRVEDIAYLLKYDSIHGQYQGTVHTEGDTLFVNGKAVHVTSEKNPSNINWKQADVQYVTEATGLFLTRETVQGHLSAGAKKVVMTAPSKDDTPMLVMSVNHNNYSPGWDVVSNASCTTNCLAPIAKVIHDHWEIEEGFMTTVHAVTASQKLTDGLSLKNQRAGRAAYQNIIPLSTGAAKALGKVIPDLDGKVTGMAFRVPTPDVSVIDFTIKLKNPASYRAIKEAMKTASESTMKGILGYTEDAVVSGDFVGDPRTAIFDAEAGIMLSDRFVKVVAWYDNEWGYSNKILDLMQYMHFVISKHPIETQ